MKEAKNIEPAAEDIESARAAMVMEPDAIKANRMIDAQRQAILRGLERCEKQLKTMQKRRRKSEDLDFMNEPPPRIPVRTGPRKSIAMADD